MNKMFTGPHYQGAHMVTPQQRTVEFVPATHHSGGGGRRELKTCRRLKDLGVLVACCPHIEVGASPLAPNRYADCLNFSTTHSQPLDRADTG